MVNTQLKLLNHFLFFKLFCVRQTRADIYVISKLKKLFFKKYINILSTMHDLIRAKKKLQKKLFKSYYLLKRSETIFYVKNQPTSWQFVFKTEFVSPLLLNSDWP